MGEHCGQARQGPGFPERRADAGAESHNFLADVIDGVAFEADEQGIEALADPLAGAACEILGSDREDRDSGRTDRCGTSN